MPIATQLPGAFSISKMRADLSIMEGKEWRAVIPRKGTAWTGLALRSYDGQISTLDYRPPPYEDTPLLEAMPYFGEIIASFHCELYRVRLLSMPPGSIIGEHTDVLANEVGHEVRLHIPIITNPRVVFRVAGEVIQMPAGELWYLDVSQPHSVENLGNETRIHLVLDCLVNDWTRHLLQSRS